ncbi:WD40-repeat-containing domain protein [Mycena alexandri]|uniref:WD40-repeat-containing domain protein n=1 Tax=Mycena alexandri TaxID=1745969 RepID=A0AAD6T564_9AGAR|nr:WD40-repeat-containing domain protein [Mycena alexandri]
MAFFSSSSNTGVNAVQKDIEVADPPGDSVSSLAFSNQADFLAVGSWDNSVRIYEIGPGGKSQGKAMYQHEGPVLSVCWSQDGSRIFSGGADNAGRMYDVATGQSTQVAQHDAPVKAVKWIESPQSGILATGSWDKTIKYWDLRTPSPIASVQLPERCYSMDVQYPLMVVGTAERHISIFNLTNPTVLYKATQSPLKLQTRVVSCFKASTEQGFAVGSVEGRAAFQYIEAKDENKNFSFRCHRVTPSTNAKDVVIYSVNDISFHPVHGTFSTCGGDGTIGFWDKDARIRLKTFDAAPGPISASTFNRDGSIFAYGVSYDWHKGHGGMTPGHPNKIMLHACKDDEVKKRPARK